MVGFVTLHTVYLDEVRNDMWLWWHREAIVQWLSVPARPFLIPTVG